MAEQKRPIAEVPLMGRSHRPRPKRLGEKLRQIRVSLNLTLEQMIKRLNYKESPLYPTNISGMERGEREPPLALLLIYARLGGVSTDLLIDDAVDLPPKLSTQGRNCKFKKIRSAKAIKAKTNR